MPGWAVPGCGMRSTRSSPDGEGRAAPGQLSRVWFGDLSQEQVDLSEEPGPGRFVGEHEVIAAGQ